MIHESISLKQWGTLQKCLDFTDDYLGGQSYCMGTRTWTLENKWIVSIIYPHFYTHFPLLFSVNSHSIASVNTGTIVQFGQPQSHTLPLEYTLKGLMVPYQWTVMILRVLVLVKLTKQYIEAVAKWIGSLWSIFRLI